MYINAIYTTIAIFIAETYTSIQDTLIPIEKGLLLWYRSPSIVVGIHESFSLRGL